VFPTTSRVAVGLPNTGKYDNDERTVGDFSVGDYHIATTGYTLYCATSDARSVPRGTNLIFLFAFVMTTLPENPTFRRVGPTCRTLNFRDRRAYFGGKMESKALGERSSYQLMSLASRIKAIHHAMTGEELADLLKVSRLTILRRAKRGRFPAFVSAVVCGSILQISADGSSIWV
jgi:hypothetical protein